LSVHWPKTGPPGTNCTAWKWTTTPGSAGSCGTAAGTLATPPEAEKKPHRVTVLLASCCVQPGASGIEAWSVAPNRISSALGVVVNVSANAGFGTTGRPTAASTGAGVPQPGPSTATPAAVAGTCAATLTCGAPGPGSAWSIATTPDAGATSQSNQ